jgi:hypothetical protein
MQTGRETDMNLDGSNKTKFLVMKSGFFENIFEPLLKVYGAPGVSMIYMMGGECGVDEVNQIRSGLNENTPMTKREILEKACSRFSQMGLGRISVEGFDPLEGIVGVNVKLNSFSGRCGSNISGGCFFLQGLLLGTASEVLERELLYSTPRCRKTSDGSCLLSFTGFMR